MTPRTREVHAEVCSQKETAIKGSLSSGGSRELPVPEERETEGCGLREEERFEGTPKQVLLRAFQGPVSHKRPTLVA